MNIYQINDIEEMLMTTSKGDRQKFQSVSAGFGSMGKMVV